MQILAKEFSNRIHTWRSDIMTALRIPLTRFCDLAIFNFDKVRIPAFDDAMAQHGG